MLISMYFQDDVAFSMGFIHLMCKTNKFQLWVQTGLSTRDMLGRYFGRYHRSKEACYKSSFVKVLADFLNCEKREASRTKNRNNLLVTGF